MEPRLPAWCGWRFRPTTTPQGAANRRSPRSNDALRARDDVSNVGVIEFMLLNALGNNSRTVNVDGFQPPKGTTGFDIDATSADSGFFDAGGLTLVSGRLFNSADVPGRERWSS